ncbi:MAG TPA: penicillin-binding transpeptidase domain-containing protein, partial [Patescibacteria group bacterium]|nr:penicillin-binding transpeptidase domain-containing protein [Patescibacteria group bacterium]
FPPGSIFKLITTSAALEKNIIHVTDEWYCKGYTTFGNRKYYCARKRGHGHLSLKQAVAQSCNTLFFEIGKQLDIDVLADYAHRFGLGKSTGISLQEQYGLVPTREWKRIVKGQPWWPGETLSAVIGQTFLLASPLQIACLIGSIFTKKLITPRILEDEEIHSIPLNIKQETLTFLKKSMKSVVRRGTGKQIPTIQDIDIFAKTSTAQISSLEKAAQNKAFSEHGWFAAYFTYKNTNPLVFVLLVEKAGSSRIPTTIAKQFFLKYKKLMSLKEPIF